MTSAPVQKTTTTTNKPQIIVFTLIGKGVNIALVYLGILVDELFKVVVFR